MIDTHNHRFTIVRAGKVKGSLERECEVCHEVERTSRATNRKVARTHGYR